MVNWMLQEMIDLRIELRDKSFLNLCFVGHAKGAKANYEYYRDAFTDCNMALGSSSSEDLWDVNAAVC
ncbi:hypothetical protein K1719_026063 [Acacia pycnantha]|nr:hypothetical protein K1719_026063 [Acacia pycnantha]